LSITERQTLQNPVEANQCTLLPVSAYIFASATAAVHVFSVQHTSTFLFDEVASNSSTESHDRSSFFSTLRSSLYNTSNAETYSLYRLYLPFSLLRSATLLNGCGDETIPTLLPTLRPYLVSSCTFRYTRTTKLRKRRSVWNYILRKGISSLAALSRLRTTSLRLMKDGGTLRAM
jgi:hypothetical protein